VKEYDDGERVHDFFLAHEFLKGFDGNWLDRRDAFADLKPTGYICDGLNVVFLNLDEGANRRRTNGIASSRLSQNCGKSTCC